MAASYTCAGMVAATCLVWASWRGPTAAASLTWSGAFLLANLARDAHVYRCSQRAKDDVLALTSRDLHTATLWYFIIAALWAIGLAMISRHIDTPGMWLLLSATTLGILSAGVLASVNVPLIALTWLCTLTLGSTYVVLRLGLDQRAMTLALLGLYTVVLLSSIAVTSRIFIARVQAEFLAEHERQVVELLLGDFEENASDWLWESDARGALTRPSHRLALTLGLDETQIKGCELWSLFCEEALLRVASDRLVGSMVLKECLSGSSAFRGVVVEARVNQKLRSWVISAKPLRTTKGEHAGWRGVGSEVTDRRALEMESAKRERHFYHLATHDALTELPNRRAFFQRIEDLGGSSESGHARIHAVALIDLDNFKAVNDALGHCVGDAVLRSIGARLKQAISPGDFLARLGGDEFAVLLAAAPRTDVDSRVHALVERVLEQLRTPENIHHFQVDVRASIGVAIADKGDSSRCEVMRRADIALYAAKAAGRNTSKTYHSAMGDAARKRLTIVSELSRALSRDEFILHYQPVIDIASGRVVACEALVRWQHPQHGLLAPAEFIPIAEESGLILPLGLWILDHACRTASSWPSDVTIAVNVSAVQLNGHAIADVFEACIRATGLALGRVELEITESSLARDDGLARDVLVRLRERGIHLAIDDFGTGYSSMSQLSKLPFDKIKIDQSFIAGLGKGPSDPSTSIVVSLMHLSRLMDLTVVAEGVENAGQLEALKVLGCHYVQGYYYSKPVDAESILRMIHTRNTENGSPPAAQSKDA